MKIYVQTRLLLSLLVFTLICMLSACSPSSGTTSTIPRTTPTPTQPVSAQQILTSPVTYVALGASDAVGVGSDRPSVQGYVPLLATRLHKGSRLINLGISGIRLHEALTRELPLALNTSPTLITIWLVANDFTGHVPYDNYIHDLDALLKQLRAGTKARIVMANLPDLTRLPSFANLSSNQKASMLAQIKQWNTGIAATAARYMVTLVDLFSHQSQLTAHPEYISGDGFHPSPAGYAQLANYFWQGITAS